MSNNSHNLRGAALALLGMGLYATHDVVVKHLGSTYSAIQILFFGALMSFPLVSFLSLADRNGGNLRPRQPFWVILRSICMVLTTVFAFYAFTVLPLAQTYAIFFAMPLLITLLSIPMLGEHVGVRRGMAVLVGLAGVLIVLRPGQAVLEFGHLVALFAAFSGALNSVIVRKIGTAERSAVLMLYPMIATFFLTGATLPFVYRPMPLEHLALMGVIAGLGFGAAMLTIAAYRAAPAVIVAPMQYSQIIWAAVYGTMFFDENIDGWTMVGTAVIVASGVYIVLREGTPRVSRNSPVLSNRSRAETGLMPRIGLMLRRGSD